MNEVTLEMPDNVDMYGPPTWRDRMAFEFALRAINNREMSLGTFKVIATEAYDFADAMIAESINRFA